MSQVYLKARIICDVIFSIFLVDGLHHPCNCKGRKRWTICLFWIYQWRISQCYCLICFLFHCHSPAYWDSFGRSNAYFGNFLTRKNSVKNWSWKGNFNPIHYLLGERTLILVIFWPGKRKVLSIIELEKAIFIVYIMYYRPIMLFKT